MKEQRYYFFRETYLREELEFAKIALFERVILEGDNLNPNHAINSTSSFVEAGGGISRFVQLLNV